MATPVRQVPLSCPGHTRPVVHLKYSELTPKGFYFISACKDGKPMLRLGHTGDWVGTFEGHKGAVWGATLTQDASLAATGAADFTAKIWNVETGDELCTFPHKHIVKTVDFSRDSASLLTGCNDQVVRVFDVEQRTIIEELKGHTSAIKVTQWGKEDNVVLSSSEDNEIRMWDTRTKEVIRRSKMADPISSFDASADKSQLVVAHGKSVSFLDSSSLQLLKTFPLKTKVNTAALHPTEPIFVAGGEDFLIYKVDFESGKELESHKGHFGPVHCIRYSPDGEVYVSGAEDGTIRLWQQTIGKTYGLWESPKGNGGPGAQPTPER